MTVFCMNKNPSEYTCFFISVIQVLCIRYLEIRPMILISQIWEHVCFKDHLKTLKDADYTAC